MSGPSLTEKLANVQHMPSLIAATVASDKPTDLYLVRDIVKMSYESMQTRVFLQKYLTNLLLTSRNVLVKLKVLKLVDVLLEEGHPDFHRNLQKSPESFKDSARIKTTDLSMAADCGRIRDIANKILDKLFNEPPEERQCPYGINPSASHVTSSSSHVTSYSNTKGGGALGGRIQGFGTTSNQSSTQSSSISEQFSNAVGTFLGTAISGPSKPHTPSKSAPYDSKYATLDYIPQSSSVGRVGGVGSTHAVNDLSYTGSEHVKGKPGGGWDKEEEPVTMETTATPKTSTNDNNEQESRLVNEITTPGGVRVAPPKDDLKRFVSRCKSLDCLSIVEFLRLKLQSDNSQVILRTLFVLESLVRSDIPDIFSYLDLILDDLTRLSTANSQPTIKAKSVKLLHLLNAVSDPVHNSVSSNTTGSLLEVGGATTEETNQPDNVATLFSGLTFTDSTSTKTSTKTSLVKESTSHTVTTPTVTTPSNNDLVDFNIQDESALDPLLTMTSSSSHNTDDPLGGLISLDEATPTTATPTTNILLPTDVSSLVGGVTVQTTPTQTAMPTYTPLSGGPGILGGNTGPSTMYQMMYSHPQLSSTSNRPVQMMSQTTNDSNSDSSGFDFLSKGNAKAGAFDFIQDEMKAASRKK